jgi:hypothetical protein
MAEALYRDGETDGDSQREEHTKHWMTAGAVVGWLRYMLYNLAGAGALGFAVCVPIAGYLSHREFR